MIHFTDGRVPDPGMAAIFATERQWQRCLDVEATLALVQSRFGVIPPDAGTAIARVAHVGKVDLDRVEAVVAESSHPLMPRRSASRTSEAVMLALGEVIGRQAAHDVVRDAADTARAAGRHLADVLSADPRVHEHLYGSALAALLDPAAHTGLSDRIAAEAIEQARIAACAGGANPR
jgi:adenylosuccinate lyase